MTLRVLLLGALAGALVSAPAATAAAPTGLRAGAASADITPPIGTPMFAYTARSAIAGGHVERPMQIVADPDPRLYAKSFVPSEGIHTRVQARAIVLEEGGRKYALVQADLGGLPYALTNEVAKRVADAGIAEDRILLSATHTHASTGPIWPADNAGYAALGGDLFDPRVFEITVQGIAEAILRADAALRPAKAGVGTARVTDASNNRSYEPYLLNPEVAKNADGTPKDPSAAKANSIDPDLTVVRVDDRKGKPIAVWSNFAVHQTSFGDGNLLFSGDNAGITEELVSRALSDRAGGREVVDVWTNGNEGDIAPNGGPSTIDGQQAEYVTSSFASAHRTGVKVARGVLNAWLDAGRNLRTDLPIGTRRSFTTFDGTPANGEPVGPQPVLGAGVVQGGMCAPVDGMAGPGQGRKFPGVAGVGLVPNVIPVAMWRFGRLGVAAFPSEVTRTMGARIREGLRGQAKGAFDRVALAGLSNAYVSYTSTPEEYDACEYEGSFTLFGRQQGARFLDMAKAVNAALLGGQPAPDSLLTPPALGIGTTQDLPARRTASAGTAVTEPAAGATRFGRASFSWNGGDPAVDAPRGATFVKVQRRVGSSWRTEVTDASFRDITSRAPGDVYTETVQFGECDPTGTYRIAVTGRADRGNGVEPYAVTSKTFTLAPLTLTAGAPTVSGRVASVQALYPNPGPEALMSLPRLVRTGIATFRVNGRERTARADAATATFRLGVPDGATVELVRVTDACGNTTA